MGYIQSEHEIKEHQDYFFIRWSRIRSDRVTNLLQGQGIDLKSSFLTTTSVFMLAGLDTKKGTIKSDSGIRKHCAVELLNGSSRCPASCVNQLYAEHLRSRRPLIGSANLSRMLTRYAQIAPEYLENA